MLETITRNITNTFYTYYTVSTAAEMQKDPARLSRAAGELIGSVVRLVFHDAAEYSPSSFPIDRLRSDGCVHVGHPDNDMGINIAIDLMNTWWKPWCAYISRADFWVLAAQTMMTETCPYSNSRRGNSDGRVLVYDPTVNRRRQLLTENALTTYTQENQHKDTYHPLLAPRSLLKGEARHEYVIFPFRYGRIDRTNCSYNDNRLPSAEKGPGEIVRSLMTNLGLTEAETVALVGAHTLGAAAKNRSGYNESMWKDRSDLWDITYYKILATVPFTRNPTLKHPLTGERLQEWDNMGNSKRNFQSFMLNVDMQLVFHIDPSNASVPVCNVTKPLAVSVDPGNIILNNNATTAKSGNCPFLKSSKQFPDFSKYVLLFAEGNTASEDEPGASRWMANFTSAWRHITELGYSGDEELQCPQCSNNKTWMSNCPQCTVEETCYGQTNWEPLCDVSYPDCPVTNNVTGSPSSTASPVSAVSPTGGAAVSSTSSVSPTGSVSWTSSRTSSPTPFPRLAISVKIAGLDITMINNTGGLNSSVALTFKHHLALMLNVSTERVKVKSIGVSTVPNGRRRVLLDVIEFRADVLFDTPAALTATETLFNDLSSNSSNFDTMLQGIANVAGVQVSTLSMKVASSSNPYVPPLSTTDTDKNNDNKSQQTISIVIGIIVGIAVLVGLTVGISLYWKKSKQINILSGTDPSLMMMKSNGNENNPKKQYGNSSILPSRYTGASPGPLSSTDPGSKPVTTRNNPVAAASTVKYIVPGVRA